MRKFILPFCLLSVLTGGSQALFAYYKPSCEYFQIRAREAQSPEQAKEFAEEISSRLKEVTESRKITSNALKAQAELTSMAHKKYSEAGSFKSKISLAGSSQETQDKTNQAIADAKEAQEELKRASVSARKDLKEMDQDIACICGVLSNLNQEGQAVNIPKNMGERIGEMLPPEERAKKAGERKTQIFRLGGMTGDSWTSAIQGAARKDFDNAPTTNIDCEGQMKEECLGSFKRAFASLDPETTHLFIAGHANPTGMSLGHAVGYDQKGKRAQGVLTRADVAQLRLPPGSKLEAVHLFGCNTAGYSGLSKAMGKEDPEGQTLADTFANSLGVKVTAYKGYTAESEIAGFINKDREIAVNPKGELKKRGLPGFSAESICRSKAGPFY